MVYLVKYQVRHGSSLVRFFDVVDSSTVQYDVFYVLLSPYVFVQLYILH